MLRKEQIYLPENLTEALIAEIREQYPGLNLKRSEAIRVWITNRFDPQRAMNYLDPLETTEQTAIPIPMQPKGPTRPRKRSNKK